jgi:zinc protease
MAQRLYWLNALGVPLVELNFQFNFGYAQENNDELGYTNFMMDMLNEGTKKYSSLQFDEALDSLGSNLGFSSGLDTSYVTVSSLKANLSDTLDLAKEALIFPTFPQNEIDRIKKQTLAAIIQEEIDLQQLPTETLVNCFTGKIIHMESH